MKSIKIVFLIFLCVSLVGVSVLFWRLATGRQIGFPLSRNLELTEVLNDVWSANEYVSIELDTDSLDIFVTVNPDAKDIHLSCFQYDNWDVDVKDDGKNLHVSTSGQTSWSSVFWFGVGRSPYLTIEVPADFDGDLKMISSSGDIEMKGDFSAESVLLKTKSGDIYSDYVTADSISLECSSGDISFRELTGKQVDLRTTSGNITGDRVDGNMLIKASSGNMRLKELIGDGEFNTTSGDIDIDEFVQMRSDVAITSSSGNIDVKKFCDLGGDLSLTATSGDIDIFFKEQPEVSITGETKSGDLRIFSERHERSVRLENNSALYQISVQTSSGDVELKGG